MTSPTGTRRVPDIDHDPSMAERIAKGQAATADSVERLADYQTIAQLRAQVAALEAKTQPIKESPGNRDLSKAMPKSD